MRRAVKVTLGALAVIVALLLLNALALSNETREAEVRTEGAAIVETSIGGLQVLDEAQEAGPPIVLLHCYSCSLRWWDELAPRLAGEHRVIRVDLLGHGGSDKPKSGYEIEQQAGGVAEALAELGVEDATVVGHSMGGAVAAALAAQSPRLASRVAEIGVAPDHSYGDLSFAARLGHAPVIGQALNRLARIAPASLVEDQYAQAFAPGFVIASGFEDPDQVVEDLRAMTYTSYSDAAAASEDYTDAEPLDERLAATGVPLLVVLGAEDRIYDAPRAAEAFEEVPGARVELLEGVGHSPNVEAPERVAELIAQLAEPPRVPSRPSPRRPRPRPGTGPGPDG